MSFEPFLTVTNPTTTDLANSAGGSGGSVSGDTLGGLASQDRRVSAEL